MGVKKNVKCSVNICVRASIGAVTHLCFLLIIVSCSSEDSHFNGGAFGRESVSYPMLLGRFCSN